MNQAQKNEFVERIQNVLAEHDQGMEGLSKDIEAISAGLFNFSATLAEGDHSTIELYNAASELDDSEEKSKLLARISARKEAIQIGRAALEQAQNKYLDGITAICNSMMDSEPMKRAKEDAKIHLEKV